MLPEARRGARERGASAAGDADVLGGVLRGQALAVEAVVEASDRLAQLPETGDGRVLLIVRRRSSTSCTRGGAPGKLARLGLALAEVAPLGIARREAELRRLAGDEDDARSSDGPKRVKVVAHGDVDVSAIDDFDTFSTADRPRVTASSAALRYLWPIRS